MTFNFQQLKKKYNKQNQKQHEQIQNTQKLVLFDDYQINPQVIEQCKKIQTQYAKFYNNNRYFYLHADPQHINTIQKIKEDQFNKIRKDSQLSLYSEKEVKEKEKEKEKEKIINESPKKKTNRAIRQQKFRHSAYLFRKNIKIIIKKLKKLKITVRDIFQKNIFSEEPYKYGKDIFQAVKSGEETKLWRHYIQNKFVIYSVDSTKKTLLIWACMRGFSKVAEMLIEMGTLMNKRDLLGHTALHYAIHYQQQNCVKILLLNLVQVNEEDIELAKKDKKMKNMIQLYLSTMGSLQNMPFSKRIEFFQQRLKHLT